MSARVRGRVVKPSRTLDEATADAEVAYEETRLAKRAPAARRRLVGLLVVGVLALVIDAIARNPFWALPALFVALAAWGVNRARLSGIVGAGLSALLAAPLGIAALARGATGGDLVAALVAIVLGVGALPDVVLLVRDAELQHAYGMWARREQ